MRRDINKEQLYTAVKTLVESEAAHIHLGQQKLFTLFSIAFQYILFLSTKDPGVYIIRIEDSFLAEKLARKAKDETSRRWMQKIYLPRRMKFEKSQLYLDFFNVQSWAITKDIPKERIKGALIVKNTQKNPMSEMAELEEDTTEDIQMMDLPEDLYYTSLTSFVPKTITIAFGEEFDGAQKVCFDFIKEESERLASGVKISGDVDLNNLED